MFEMRASDLSGVLKELERFGRESAPEVSRLALNDTAFAVLGENKKLMERVFDRPNPFTLRAFRVQKATREDLTAVVLRKDMAARRHYLEVQSAGGARPQTGLERLMRTRLKYSGLIQSVLPTKNFRTNRYGNMAPGRVQQMLASVKAQGDRQQNTTATSRAKARGKRADYFVPKVGSSLSPGVYERRGKRIRKMLAFSQSAPRYRARFEMEAHGEEVARNAIAPAYERAFKRVIGG